MAEITSTQVWQEIEKHLFAVIGMVTAGNESRTVGIVYVVHKRKLYITSLKTAWKVRHITQNPHVSLTIPIAKRIPFIPWVKIPAATITFHGQAKILPPEMVPEEVIQKLLRGTDVSSENAPPFVIIEVTPEDEFITYGVGVPMLTMRDTQKARGQVPV